MNDQSRPNSIRQQIKTKQNELSDYLSYLEPLGTRLTYFSIVGGAVAALLNAEVIRLLGQNALSATSWIIPLVAALLSLAATIATSVNKTQIESRLSQFQKSAAKMEGLAALLDAQQLTEEVAAKRFLKYVEECPPIPRRQKFVFEAIKGTIRQPVEGQVVPANFEASGTASNLGQDAYLWLMIEIDDSIWPKEGRIMVGRDEHWIQPVFEDGVGGQFSLSLWAANSDADNKLRAWLDQGNRTRTFPPLRPLPGMRRLARVSGLKRSN
jgi:hypothetical protein